MPRIHVLDKSVYELIAAGEVIERPSSVIKEMVENSIDAEATAITVEIKNGGRTFMRITDNGCGMLPEDVPLSFVRHATSKIDSKDDLEAIYTLGFRGEALASVAAVSKVEVMTKQHDAPMGFRYQIEGGEEKDSGPAGCPDGTTFIIRDLFFNIPARQKYMKKDVTEGNSVASVLQKLALSHPEIAFKFIRDNKVEFVTNGNGKLLSCIYTIMGKAFHDGCVPVEYSQDNIKINGYVTKPLAAYANRSYQNFFVNSRYVKSTTCMFAMEESFKGKLMVGKFPGCVLHIKVDPESIDVNAHPAKLEIRFQNETQIYNAVYFAVKNALMLCDTPEEISLKPSSDKVFAPNEVYGEDESNEKPIQLTLSSPVRPSRGGGDYTFVPMREGIKSVMSGYIQPEEPKAPEPQKPLSDDSVSSGDIGGFKYINSRSIEKKEPVKEEMPELAEAEKTVPPIKVIGEVFKTYIVAECGSDVILVDKHAAHERLIYEKIRNQQEDLDMQLLFEPVNTTVSYEIYDALQNNPQAALKIGLGVKLLYPPVISLYGVPTIADNMDPIDILTRLAECLLCGKKNEGTEIFDDLYHSMACKAAIKAHSDTDKIELIRLLELVTADDLRYCPHGRPILIKLTNREIEKMFRRIQQ